MLGSRLRGDGTRPAWLIAPVAAVWAALIGLAILIVPLLIVWMATPQSGLTWLESLRVAGLIWVVAHGTPIAIAGTTYSLLPWGFALIPLLLLGYAGGWAARRTAVSTVREIAGLVGLASVTYALLVLAAAEIVSDSISAVSPVVAFASAAVMAVVAFGWGAVRASRLDVSALVPDSLALIVRGGLSEQWPSSASARWPRRCRFSCMSTTRSLCRSPFMQASEAGSGCSWPGS